MENLDIVIEILEELHPDVDFETNHKLVDNKIIDSFDIVALVSELCEEFDITISVNEIVPDNFNSAQALTKMVERLIEEE